MNTTEIRREAKQRLQGSWGLGNGAIWLAMILPLIPIFTITPLFGPIELGLDQLIRIFFAAPLTVGVRWIFLGVIDREKKDIGSLFDVFRNYWRVIGITFISGLFITLWSLAPLIPALIIGGLVLALAFAIESVVIVILGILIMIIPSTFFAIWARIRYAQATYILKDNPTMDFMATITKSKELMKGNLWAYFKLELFFWIWYLPLFIFAVFTIGTMIAVFVPHLNAISRYAHHPAMLEMFIMNVIDDVLLMGVGLAVIGLLISGLYALGITFYIGPYQAAAKAMFYRKLNSQKVSHEDGFQAEETFEFYSNSPRPVEMNVEEISSNDHSEYGLRDPDED